MEVGMQLKICIRNVLTTQKLHYSQFKNGKKKEIKIKTRNSRTEGTHFLASLLDLDDTALKDVVVLIRLRTYRHWTPEYENTNGLGQHSKSFAAAM